MSTRIYIRDFEISRGKIILTFRKLDKATEPSTFVCPETEEWKQEAFGFLENYDFPCVAA